MNLEPNIVVAIASIVGAGLFFVAGLLMPRAASRKQRMARAAKSTTGIEVISDVAVVLDDTTSPFADQAAGMVMPIAATRPPALPKFTGHTVPELLGQLVRGEASAGAALYDEHGLLIGHVGSPPNAAIGARIGMIARSVRQAEANLTGDTHVFEFEDAVDGRIRSRCLKWDGRLLWLTTKATTSHPLTRTEDAVIAAIPNLLASA